MKSILETIIRLSRSDIQRISTPLPDLDFSEYEESKHDACLFTFQKGDVSINVIITTIPSDDERDLLVQQGRKTRI